MICINPRELRRRRSHAGAGNLQVPETDMPFYFCDCANNIFDQATCTSWRLLRRTVVGSSSLSHRLIVFCLLFNWIVHSSSFTDRRENCPVLSDTAWLEAWHCPRQLFCQPGSILQVNWPKKKKVPQFLQFSGNPGLLWIGKSWNSSTTDTRLQCLEDVCVLIGTKTDVIRKHLWTIIRIL